MSLLQSMQPVTPDLQLNLFFGHSEKSLALYLEEGLGRPVSLVLTDNSTSMLSARVRDGVLSVRLHRMFLNAENPVLDEIALFLKKRRSSMTLFRRFVRDNGDRLRQKPANRITEKTAGRFFDLRELYREINEEYFAGMIDAGITWGTRSPRSAVRKRTLGSYSERSHTIRINPVLDRKAVPRYYVAFVVYHEMLHAALGLSSGGRRRSIHSREFRRRERLFKDYDRALAWERKS